MSFNFEFAQDTLFPNNVYRDTYDDVAKEFLNHYGYGDLATNPTPIPILDIARKRMQLTVIVDQRLSPNQDVLGTIAFSDGEVEVFDPMSDESHAYQVKSGTILIDCDITNRGRRRNALAHECVHWYLHRYYFNRLKNGNPNADFAFRCPVYRESDRFDSSQDAERMEAQARGIAPRILMPKVAARKKIQELLSLKDFSDNHLDRVELLKDVVDEVSNFFCVSKSLAKYRMIDLGYISNVDAEAIYPDDALKLNELAITQRPLTVKPSNRPLTRHIDLSTAFEEYQNNEAFREILSSGNFRHVEGAFVLDDEKYCKKNEDGVYSLTKFARDNPAKCTLLFTYRVSGVKGNAPQTFDFPLPPDVIQMLTKARHMTSISTEYRKHPHYVPNSQSEDMRGESARLRAESEKLSADFEAFVQDRQADSTDFWERVSQHMARKKISKNRFKDLTLLDDNTISRTGGNALFGKKPPQKLTTITLKVAMAVCVGLDLDLKQSNELLALAKHTLNHETECLAYEYILTAFRGRSIYDRNDFLVERGFEPLGVKSA